MPVAKLNNIYYHHNKIRLFVINLMARLQEAYNKVLRPDGFS